MKLLGIVTLYHPSVQEELERIRTYVDGLDRLIVWNNSEDNGQLEQEIVPLLTDVADKLVWINNDRNRYIAEAIEYALTYAQKNGYDHLLLMDQDSQWAHFQDFKQEVMDVEENQPTVAAFTPYVHGSSPHRGDSPYTVRCLINSGSIFRVSALLAIGGADLRFPLDGLDSDIAYRLQQAGYHLLCLPKYELKHELGHPMRSKILKLYSSNYNAARTYFLVSGQVLVVRKHRQFLTREEKWRLIKEFVFIKLAQIILVEPDKWNRFKAYLRGLKTGLITPL